MARIFVSSTFTDLQEERKEVFLALRRLGHQSVAMESWASSEKAPLEMSLAAVRESDVLVAIVGWRYGFVPPGQQYSETELLIVAAREMGIPRLVFLVPEDAPWPKKYVDDDESQIRRFRQSLLKQYVVSFFKNSSELATQVAVVLHQWIASGASVPTRVPADAVTEEEPPGPDVFLSYAHEDVTIAESLAKRMGQERWSVFWDRKIPVGLTWDDIVEGALDAASCVVVLWSSVSRDSEWVRLEASEGAERGILAPALIEEIKIPLRFRRIQAANLIGWGPAASDTPGMRALISAVARCVRAGKGSAA